MRNWFRRAIGVLGLAISGAALSNAPVGAAPAIDQQQPVIDATVGGAAIGGFYQQKMAQVVTQGVTGSLTEVRFPVACGTGDLVVEIQGVEADRPNGVVLTSQTIPGAMLPTFFPSPPTLRALALSTPVSLSAGDRFAVVLTSAGDCGIFQGPIGDSYAGGNAFFDSRPNPVGLWVCICDFAGDRFDLPFQTVVETRPSVSVVIDIKPGSDTNTINLRSAGAIPVAILSSAAFDARTIDPRTVSLAGAGVKMVGTSGRHLCHDEDVNGDGLVDLVCQVLTADFMIEAGESLAVLEARTADGVSVRGQDMVRIVRE